LRLDETPATSTIAKTTAAARAAMTAMVVVDDELDADSGEDVLEVNGNGEVVVFVVVET
jgi:hypothetical protein